MKENRRKIAAWQRELEITGHDSPTLECFTHCGFDSKDGAPSAGPVISALAMAGVLAKPEVRQRRRRHPFQFSSSPRLPVSPSPRFQLYAPCDVPYFHL